MANRTSRPQSGQTANLNESPRSARKRQMRSWLILGAGAVGVAGAIAKWAVQARQNASTSATSNESSRADQTANLTLQTEGTGMPVPLVTGMPQSAAPTNDSRTALVEPEPSPELADNQGANPLPISAAPASAPKKAKPGKTVKPTNVTPDMITPSAIVATASGKTETKQATSGSSRKRGKMSEEYDQALQANSLPTDGREGARSAQKMENNSMTANGSTNASAAPATQPGSRQAGSAGPAPSSVAGGAAEQALSTQAEGKMAIGEELRDREFPIPQGESGAASQKLVVDQETLHDGGTREGGVIGTVLGDRQNKGEVGDIEDQAAKTPDFAQQR